MKMHFQWKRERGWQLGGGIDRTKEIEKEGKKEIDVPEVM